jgi:ribonuclease BN (tRNA processing enzyme)
MSVKVTFVGSGDAFGAGGRFNTCFMVDAPGVRFVIDFGATSLVALAKMGIDHNSIDAIVLTHIHADHCAGIPFMLMDAMLGAKRKTPLIIAGPRDTTARMAEVSEVLFPGMHVMQPKFALEYIEMDVMRPARVGKHIVVTPYPALHTGETNPTSVRCEVAGKVVSYTGDSAWTKHMPALGRDADLLISECYFYEKPIRFHLNYPDVKQHWDEFGAKRIVLTHFSREMMAKKDEVPEECAYDGLVVEL